MSIEKPKISKTKDPSIEKPKDIITEEMIIQATNDLKNLQEKIKNNEPRIGDVIAITQKYENTQFDNPAPIDIRFPDDGFDLEYNSGEVYSESDSFKQHIEENTDMGKFLKDFSSSDDKDYNEFKNIYAKYSDSLEEQGITDIGYYKYGKSRNTPARLAMYVDKEKFKQYFGKEENYDEKLEIYNKKQELIKNFYESLKALETTAKIDEALVELKEKTKMDDDEIKDYLKVDNLYTKFNQIEPLVNVMAHASFQKDKMFAKITSGNTVEGDYVIPTPADDRHLNDEVSRILYVESHKPYPSKPTKNYSAGIAVVVDGKMGAVAFPPYMEYEDFEGGATRRYPYNDVKEILNIEETNDGVKVKYLAGNDLKYEQLFKGMKSISEKAKEYIKNAQDREKEGGFYGFGFAGENYESAGLLDKAQECYEKAIEIHEKDYKYTKPFTKSGFKEAKDRYDEIQRNKKAEFDSWTSDY